MPTTAPLPDATRCPLCGGDNRCARELERATRVPQGACWCAQVEFGAALLARVPVESRGEACICAACARGSAPA